MANGQWHEGVNIAAVNDLPLLLICENNHLAGNVRPEHYVSLFALDSRADAYGIHSEMVDGNDVEAVQRAAMEGVEHVRETSSPFLLVCDTTRLGRHKQGQGDLRSKKEIAELALRDPLRDVIAQKRLEMDLMVDDLIERIQRMPDAQSRAAL